MAYLVQKEDLCKVSDYLKQHLPSSVTNPIFRQAVHLFCIDPEEIIGILSSPGVMNTSENILFYGISERDMEFVTSMSILVNFKITCRRTILRLWCYDKVDIPECTIADGFELSEITADITKATAKTSCTMDKDGGEEVMQDLIKWKFPNVCARTPCGEPIAWVTQTFWGDQGSLFVKNAYRRKGIAKCIVSQLARRLFDVQGSVYVNIDDDNTASIKLHEDVGFRKVENQKYLWTWFSLK